MSKPRQIVVLPKVCRYCNADLSFTNYGFYHVKQAVKPPKTSYRTQLIGYACEHCVDVDQQPVLIDPWKEVSE